MNDAQRMDPIGFASGNQPARLPNGLYAWEPLPGNASFMYPQILEYFRHGVEINPGATVLDVGAHIGVFALEVLRRSAGTAHLYCCEPAPETHAYLKRNVTEQFPDADVHFHCCGLSSNPGAATLYFRPLAPQMTGLTPRYDGEEQLQSMVDLIFDRQAPEEYRRLLPSWLPYVPRFLVRGLAQRRMRRAVETVREIPCELKTVSAIVREHSLETIDLLKIDVEGAELDVILGIEDSDWPKIRSVTLEVHDTAGRVDELRGLFRRRGFADVVVDQEYIFKGTRIYGMFAVRR